MAKTKKTKDKSEDSSKLKKSEIKAYYKEHGWRKTISHFGIAPKDLSPLVKGSEGGGEKAPKKKVKKEKKVKEGKVKEKKNKKEKKAKKVKSEDAPYGLKKDGTPKKPPGRKGGSTPKKTTEEDAAPKKRGRPKKNVDAAEAASAPKKRGRPKKNVDAAEASAAPKKRGRPKGAGSPSVKSEAAGSTLDWLIAFRKRNPGASVDCAIVELAIKTQRI